MTLDMHKYIGILVAGLITLLIGCTDNGGSTLWSEPLGSVNRFYLVRGARCGVKGEVESGGSGQVGTRGNEILASPNDCP